MTAIDGVRVVKPFATAKRQWEQQYLLLVMVLAGGKVARAAQLAGVTRQGMYGLLDKCGLNKEIRK